MMRVTHYARSQENQPGAESTVGEGEERGLAKWL